MVRYRLSAELNEQQIYKRHSVKSRCTSGKEKPICTRKRLKSLISLTERIFCKDNTQYSLEATFGFNVCWFGLGNTFMILSVLVVARDALPWITKKLLSMVTSRRVRQFINFVATDCAAYLYSK